MEQSQAPGDSGQTAESSSVSRTIDVSILGGRKFKGRWRPPKTMTLVSLLGGRELDFREAEIPPEGITINAFGLIGGTHVIVPDGVNVEVSGFSGLGGRRVDSHAEPGAPGKSVVRLHVFGAVGGLKVESRPAADDAISTPDDS
jgi:hypothetical protein